MTMTRSRKVGFTLVEIMIVVAIVGLLAAMAIPNFVKYRATSQCNACINNLRQIDSAKQQWALQQAQVSSTATPTATSLQPYFGRSSTGQFPTCPAAGNYTINNLTTSPTCSWSSLTPSHQLSP